MAYLEMTEQELRDYVECGGLDDDMFFSLHKAALEKLRELQEYVKYLEKAEESLNNLLEGK